MSHVCRICSRCSNTVNVVRKVTFFSLSGFRLHWPVGFDLISSQGCWCLGWMCKCCMNVYAVASLERIWQHEKHDKVKTTNAKKNMCFLTMFRVFELEKQNVYELGKLCRWNVLCSFFIPLRTFKECVHQCIVNISTYLNWIYEIRKFSGWISRWRWNGRDDGALGRCWFRIDVVHCWSSCEQSSSWSHLRIELEDL